MTMNEVIRDLEGLKANVVPDQTKMKWIASVDGLVSLQIHKDDEAVSYAIPDDADNELLLKAPFDDIYALYCSAMVDFYNREYNSYNFSVQLFNDRLEEYKAYYIQRNRPCKANNFRNVMG